VKSPQCDASRRSAQLWAVESLNPNVEPLLRIDIEIPNYLGSAMWSECSRTVGEANSVLLKLRNCTVPPDNLRSAISFSRTSNVLNFNTVYIYISRSRHSFTVGSASLFACLHDCAIACASCATKQTFAQCRIFLEGTLEASPAGYTRGKWPRGRSRTRWCD